MNKAYTKEFFQQAGKKGGSNTAKRGKKFYQKIGKLGGITRWNNEKIPKTGDGLQKPGMDSPAPSNPKSVKG